MLSANVLVIIAAALMLAIIIGGRAHGTSVAMVVTRCGLVAAVGWILALTIFPIPIEAGQWRSHRLFRKMSFVPFRTIGWQLARGLERYEARQLFRNIALFAPLGFLLPFAARSLRRMWPTLVVAASLSVLVESAQALLPGHSTDVDDVILNAAGAALGFLAFSLITWGRMRLTTERGSPAVSAPRSAMTSSS